MRPILFQLGPLTVYSWGFMVVLATLAGLLVARGQARKKGIDPDKLIDLTLYLLIAGIVGGRLVYVIFNPAPFVARPLDIFMVQSGGLAIHGALLGGALATYWFAKRQGLPFWRLADVLAPGLILGQAIGRIGCFLNGDSYGRLSSLPWAVTFVGLPGARHPTQLYEAILDVAIFVMLLRLARLSKFDGQVFLSYLVLYSAARFVVEIFRESPTIIGSVTPAQVASVVIAAVSLVLIRRSVVQPKPAVVAGTRRKR